MKEGTDALAVVDVVVVKGAAAHRKCHFVEAAPAAKVAGPFRLNSFINIVHERGTRRKKPLDAVRCVLYNPPGKELEFGGLEAAGLVPATCDSVGHEGQRYGV